MEESAEQQERDVEEEREDSVPLYTKLSRFDVELLEKMVPLLHHYNLIPSPTKKHAISFSIRTTAVLLRKMIESKSEVKIGE